MKIKLIKFPDGDIVVPDGANFKEARQIARNMAQRRVQEITLSNFYQGFEKVKELTKQYAVYL